MNNLAGITINGRYQLLEPLGQDSVSAMYQARDTRLDQTAAIRVLNTEAIPPDHLARMLRRFESEMNAVVRLEHASIVKVYDHGVSERGEHEGAPYLVMPYLPGRSLKEKTGKPMPFQEAARLLLPVARALAYAHQQGVIHRDVKPANILFSQEGEVMLSGFGIASALEHAGMIDRGGLNVGVGTPEYMPPEQWTGKAVPQTDIYALGVVFYELVTGCKPYTAKTSAALLIRHLITPLPNPRRLVQGLPVEVERALSKALEKQPKERYASMEAFAGVLEDLISLEPAGIGRNMAQNGAAASSIKTQPVAARSAGDKPADFGSLRQAQPADSPQTASGQESGEGWRGGMLRLLAGLGLLGVAGILVIVMVMFLKNMADARQEEARQAYLTAVPETAMISGIDGMVLVYVPAGEFTMGTSEEEIDALLAEHSEWKRGWFTDELPRRSVYLDAYWIDRIEVTNAMFAAFLNQQGNQTTDGVAWLDAGDGDERMHLYGETWQVESGFADYPVMEVSWYGAQAYCEWVGGRLPTEAEWEKAARGSDGRSYPWGEGINCKLANYTPDCVGEPSLVGSYPLGAGPFGTLDMAGNVWEWTADWYAEDYYEHAPADNPQGPSFGEYRVLRGGSWREEAWQTRSTCRLKDSAANSSSLWGFRCVR